MTETNVNTALACPLRYVPQAGMVRGMTHVETVACIRQMRRARVRMVWWSYTLPPVVEDRGILLGWRSEAGLQTAWVWSEHALARFRERGGTEFVRERLPGRARLASPRAMKRIRRSCPGHVELSTHGHYTGFHYLTSERWVLVMAGNVVVTCWPQEEGGAR